MVFLRALSFTTNANFKLVVVVEVGLTEESLLMLLSLLPCVWKTVLVASINSLK